jgi:23S rRNA (uracil1939-C5)-methyltransferase
LNLYQALVTIIKDAMYLPQVGDILSVKIHGLGNSGEGVGYVDGFTFFVEGALPPEVVKVEVLQSKKRYALARLLSIESSSNDRTVPPCKLFGKCGGCQFMHLSYPKQLEAKRQKVVEALGRIGKLPSVPVGPCVASPSPLAYRNKIQLPVRQEKGALQLGLYAKGSHDLIEVDTCLIHCSLGDGIYQSLKEIIKQFRIVPYDPKTKKGELRHLLIKTAIHTKEALVIFVTNQRRSSSLSKAAKAVMECNPAVKGVIHNLHRGADNVILGSKYYTLEGSDCIHEMCCGLRFKVSPASFFQINSDQAELLYSKALEFAELKGSETVLDAYCGVGTLSLIFAKSAKKVIGVECVQEAINDAIENSRLNKIENAAFVCASSETFISSLAAADVIVLNPPRKGCELSFLEGIGRLRPKRLVYISCDPATLARDLAHLVSFGYQVDAVQPFDMFPQTVHVESIAKLTHSFCCQNHSFAPLSADR